MAFAVAALACDSPSQGQPGENVRRPATHAELTARLQAAARKSPLVTLTSIGKSVEGRDLWMVRLAPASNPAAKEPPAFLFARQHGNEPAGQEALLDMVDDVAGDRTKLPYPVLAIPCANPDGSDRNDRRNANRVDLNRDHVILSQPETQALHRAFRAAAPRFAVDCHEFGRDTTDYLNQGWTEWPLIMLDCANFPHPTLEAVYDRSVRIIDEISRTMTAEGLATCRYIVGDAPPGGEVRFSTMENDDGRNSLGLHGIPSYIIESGMFRSAPDPDFDLPLRVKAYRRMLDLLIEAHAGQGPSAIYDPSAPGAPLLPTNNFWGTTRIDPSRTVPVISNSTSETIQVAAPRFMDQRISKRIVDIPTAYAIVPNLAGRYRNLLDHHGFVYKTLAKDTTRTVTPVRLMEIEREDDRLYERFGGRQITLPQATRAESLPAGTLVVDTATSQGLRAAVVLDPRMLYGLYQHREFQQNLEDPGLVPVRLVIE